MQMYWKTTVKQLVSILVDKVDKAFNLIQEILVKTNKKITLHQLQKLCGFLNSLSCCVVPGRAFTRRLYAQGKASRATKEHHHLRISKEMRLDLEMWITFLKHPTAFCRPFIDFTDIISSQEINFFTDASGSYGMGGLCDDSWMILKWDRKFMMKYKPMIQYLEMYALLAGVVAWIHKYKNQSVKIFCDNQNVVRMVNDNSTSCEHCMKLVRIMVLHCLTLNVNLSAEYIKSKDNDLADPISRGELNLFFKRIRDREMKMSALPTPVPAILLPMDKFWIC